MAERDPVTGRFVSSGFETLAARLDAVGKRAVKNVEIAVRKAALLADQALVLGTPFDEGLARGGWVATIGGPDLSEQGVKDKDGQVTIAKNQPIILSFRVGKALYISNAVKYIGILDAGRFENPGRGSFQAPNGFSKQAAEIARNELRRQRYL